MMAPAASFAGGGLFGPSSHSTAPRSPRGRGTVVSHLLGGLGRSQVEYSLRPKTRYEEWRRLDCPEVCGSMHMEPRIPTYRKCTTRLWHERAGDTRRVVRKP